MSWYVSCQEWEDEELISNRRREERTNNEQHERHAQWVASSIWLWNESWFGRWEGDEDDEVESVSSSVADFMAQAKREMEAMQQAAGLWDSIEFCIVHSFIS